MTTGVMYMAWGENAVSQAENSMRSLWHHDRNMPVMVVGDEKAQAHFAGSKVQFQLINIDPFNHQGPQGYKFLAGRIKPLLAGISPFDRTLYVDADTYFKQGPKDGFELLDRWDLAVAETQTRSLDEGIAGHKECVGTSTWLGTKQILYHNSGMIFWKKNERTVNLFKLWSEEWQKYKGWDEQVALLRALIRSDCMFLTLPHTWNCYTDSDSFLLRHWFGGGQARIEAKHHRFMPNQPRDTRKMVKVEIAPGRFVKVYQGDEEKAKKHYAEVLKGRNK